MANKSKQPTGEAVTVGDKRREVFLSSIAKGLSQTLAARAAGINPSTAWEWKKDPEWAAKVEAAEIAHINKHLGIINRAAEDGEWQASKWLLSVRHRDEFGQRVEVTGKEGGPVQIETREPVELTDAELRAELARLTPEAPKADS